MPIVIGKHEKRYSDQDWITNDDKHCLNPDVSAVIYFSDKMNEFGNQGVNQCMLEKCFIFNMLH